MADRLLDHGSPNKVSMKKKNMNWGISPGYIL